MSVAVRSVGAAGASEGLGKKIPGPTGKAKNIMRVKTTVAMILLLSLCAGANAQKTSAAEIARVDAITASICDNLRVAMDRHWHHGEYNHLVNLSKVLVTLQPDDVDAYTSSAWLLWSMDKDAEAVEMYKWAIANNPNTYQGYDELGHYYYERKKDYKQSLHYYLLAAKQKDHPAPTLHMLAHAYERNGMLQKACDTWREAVAFKGNPNLGAARYNMGRVKALLDKKKQGR